MCSQIHSIPVNTRIEQLYTQYRYYKYTVSYKTIIHFIVEQKIGADDEQNGKIWGEEERGFWR